MKHYFLTTMMTLVSFVSFAQRGIFYPNERLSNSLISSICQDKAGYVWVGTDYGLNRFDGYSFVKYFHNANDSTTLMYNTVVTLCCDEEGSLWVGTGKGLQRYCSVTDNFVNYRFVDGRNARVNDILMLRDGRILVGTAGYGLYEVDKARRILTPVHDQPLNKVEPYFSHLFEDSGGNLWKSGTNEITCRTANGELRLYNNLPGTPSDFFEYRGKVVAVCRDALVIFYKGEMITDYFEMPEMNGGTLGLRVAYCDSKENVYVGTRGNGLFWIPAGTKKLQRYQCTVRGLDMNSTKIWAITEDRSGNIWLGCQQRGVVMIPQRKAQFSSWNFSDQKIDIGTYVSSITDGFDGMTWCTVQDKGVYGFDAEGRVVAHPAAPEGVEYLYHDSKRDYWLGTTHGMYLYNPMTGNSKLVTDFPCYVYNTVTDDHQGNVYFSAFSKGMLQYNRETGKIRHFSMTQKDKRRGSLCNDWIMDLSSDKDCNVWAATSNGVSCYDPKRDTFRPYGWEKLLDGLMCYAVCKTSKGDILIGTERGLYIWMRRSNKIDMFKGSEELKNLVVGYMVEDMKGNIWCSTSMGIWVFDLKKDKWTSYVNGSGLTAHEYVNSVGMHGDDERIYFATGGGMTVFTPKQVREAGVEPGRLMLTAFSIDGIPANASTESGGSSVMDKAVFESGEFTLSYTDNTFTMSFSLLNFPDATNTIFEYRFEGDEQWRRTQEGQNSITFTHLSSGKYVLEVRAIDNGVVSEVCKYRITVRAPWYATTVAYLIYMLLFATMVSFMIWFYRRHLHQQVEEDKMKFLINATHDIRSPLTLIMSPLKKLSDNIALLKTSDSIGSEADRRAIDGMKEEVSVIERNAQRILNLVNQILDVRKIDRQQMSLHCRETEMRKFVEVISKIYEYPAKEHNIDFRLVMPEEEVRAWIDPVQFDKVVSNLLSNSLKYCTDGGEIVLQMSTGSDTGQKNSIGDYVELKITDAGVGMRAETLEHIFERFYQERNSDNENSAGTGIGLNLCKMIVDMHHGTISAENRADGIKGSIFTVRVPLGKEHLTEEEIDTSVDKSQTHHVKAKQAVRSNYKVLLVDDDEDIGEYIADELGAYFHFTVSHNGKEGLKELLTDNYDAVVSDVMMPEMDGLTMLRMIKTNVNISHVPVIMLTSKSDIGNRLEGLEKGADAYLTKPFTMEELHLTIDNLIAKTLRLKGKFSGAQQAIDQVENVEVKGNDEQLMERIIKSVNQHLSDSDYGVEVMCEEVGISRAHLHRKMKDLTGIPVSEFIRNVRLEQAARLLKEQKVNITQVAYSVGFSSLGYFSTVFRKHFGMSPRDFIEQQQE